MSRSRRAAYTVLALVVGLGGCHLDDLLSGPQQGPHPGTPGDSTPGDEVPGPATRLAFRVQPSSAEPGTPLTPAVEVQALDQDGDPATGFTGVVTVTLETNPSGATLEGATSLDAVDGIATFSELSVDHPGRGYTLQASGGGLAAATSEPFDIGTVTDDPEPATVGGVSGDGQSGTVGGALAEPLVVRVVDADGNGVAGVTVTWATSGGGDISPATTITDADGRAAATRTLGTTAGSQTASAAVSGLNGSPVTFAATAVPDSPTTLVFRVQPTSTGAGRTIEPAVETELRDRFGNRATNFTGSVTMTITPGTGTLGAALSGTRTRPVENGVAVFDDLRIDLLGLGYRLRAGGAGLSTDSNPFNVTL